LQLVKNFPAFPGTRTFITALTSVRQLFLSWASPIQSIYPHPTSWRSILILHTHLRLGHPSGLFPSGFPTKNLYTPPLLTHTSHMHSPKHISIHLHKSSTEPVLLAFSIRAQQRSAVSTQLLDTTRQYICSTVFKGQWKV